VTPTVILNYKHFNIKSVSHLGGADHLEVDLFAVLESEVISQLFLLIYNQAAQAPFLGIQENYEILICVTFTSAVHFYQL
jgi:hypothetical protein